MQVYISRLRKTLNGAQAGAPGSAGAIATVDHGYALRVDPGQVDVRAFERLLDRGRDAFGDHEFDVAATVLRQALGLWRGPPLADFTFDAFAAADIARLQELRLEALEIRIDADLALGRHAALVAELEASPPSIRCASGSCARRSAAAAPGRHRQPRPRPDSPACAHSSIPPEATR